jgi:hypothetical protein
MKCRGNVNMKKINKFNTGRNDWKGGGDLTV